MPVFSCGGMRYQQSWQDRRPDPLDTDGQANLVAVIRRAFDLGITHVETARGYGSSEYQLGFILPHLPRERLIVQTKIAPQDSRDAFIEAFEDSLTCLQLDYVDLCSVHGLNNRALLDQTLKGGTLQALRELQDQGVVRHIGFSTHAPTEDILAAIDCGEFAYLNLHWYYFRQEHWPAILAARARDMGVFIISPTDKGGHLHSPPPKLVNLCAPLGPIGFNDLFCLSHPEVHTLSVGAARPSDFDAHLEILPLLETAQQRLRPVVRRLRNALIRRHGPDWARHWDQGLPSFATAPGGVPVYNMLRLYNLATAYDMLAFARDRYNLHGNNDHWVPGNKIDRLDAAVLAEQLREHPLAGRIANALRDTHELLDAAPQKRQSEASD